MPLDQRMRAWSSSQPERSRSSGTVTLVFTDIEGSTQLLHELGQDAYLGALTEHRRIVREAFAWPPWVRGRLRGRRLLLRVRLRISAVVPDNLGLAMQLGAIRLVEDATHDPRPA